VFWLESASVSVCVNVSVSASALLWLCTCIHMYACEQTSKEIARVQTRG
jgi:hypothetical protein